MNLEILSVVTLFLPLIAAFLVGISTGNINYKLAQIITSASVIISAICSSIIFYYVVFDHRIIHLRMFQWLNSGDLNAWWSIYVDTLTAIMFIVVTYVSSLIHLYSIGYMSHDKYKQRFMAYLSLFTFFMLMLVSADNFLQLFLGWEGVGLSSFLLIGFWFEKSSASNAAIKAFLTNRVGDIALAIGIFLLFVNFNSIEYLSIFNSMKHYSNHNIVIWDTTLDLMDCICILLFIGCMGKSAQILLHVWLPDAMEGPTPVSALIHAATMVTAGVFLVVRCSPLFEHSQIALFIITVVGALTCIFAATIALVQNDIKKIIAYSTCSQLGYMFFACGVSAYSAAIFHLMTHAFFKALLFLGAGSVIHAMHEEQDIRNMGNLWKKIPYTYILMWIGSLALGGIFPFAGFYSKDLILEAAYISGSNVGIFAYSLGLIAALMTTFYSWRLLFMVFHGENNIPKKKSGKIKESPLIMLLPMLCLAIGSIFSGMIGEKILKISSPNNEFWNGAIFVMKKNNVMNKIHDISQLIAFSPLIVGLLGILIAFIFYFRKSTIPGFLSHNFKILYNVIFNKYYFDELYNMLFVTPLKNLSKILWKRVDDNIIDGIPKGSVFVVNNAAKSFSYLQTGYIYHYAMAIVIGIIFFAYWIFFR